MNGAVSREEAREERWDGIVEAAERGRLKLVNDQIIKIGRAAEAVAYEEER